MTKISKRLEQIISKELEKNIIPIKVEEGILVGNVLIKSRDNLKFLYKNNELIYGEIFLNKAAIFIANLMAKHRSSTLADQVYQADRDFSTYFIDSQLMRTNYEKSIKNKDFVRADMFWSRYEQAKDRVQTAKSRVESLTKY
jgi:hypothetical protein